jgi:serine-type D-Ala-D-Ala carboxypeptidase/endopeptidase (penicillin-binding protein 4)
VKKVWSIVAATALVMGFTAPLSANANPGPTCSVKSLAQNKNIKSLFAEVRRADNGQVLFARSPNSAMRSASVMKVLTSVVALDALGPDYQATTRVFADKENPSKIYLVGGGDVTLSRTPGNIASLYSKAPKLDTLTRQVRTWATKEKITVSEVVIDSTLFGESGDWHPTWDLRGLSQGYMAPVSALQLDAGRLTSSSNRNLFIGQRTAKPVEQAGSLFLASLKRSNLAATATVSPGKAPADAVQIAEVKSQPISSWIENTMRVSDNAQAEALARLSSIALGFDGSSTSLTVAYKKVLDARGINSRGVEIVDGSGLSRLNKLPVRVVNDLLAQIYSAPEKHASAIAGMPVSGKPGSLRYRFYTGTQRPALYNIEAKTGWIRTGYSLAGKMRAQDGTELYFTVYNLWTSVNQTNRLAMDNLVYGFFRCGARLSDN